MKRTLLFFLFLLVGAGLFTGLVSHVGWTAIWGAIAGFSFFEVLGIMVLTAAFYFVGVVRWQGILRSQGHSVSLLGLFGAYLGGFSLSFFAPIAVFGAELFRGYELREVHDVPFTSGFASVMIDRALEITTFLVVIVLGGVIFFLHGASFAPATIAIIVTASVLVLLGMLLFYIHMFQSKSVIERFIPKSKVAQAVEIEEEVARFFYWNNPGLWKALVFSFAKSAVGAVRFWLIIVVVADVTVGFSVLTVLAFYYLALLVPIPASLGSHDALQALSFPLLGIGASSAGVAFVFVVRATEALLALAGAYVLTRTSLRAFRVLVFQRIEKIVK